MSVKKAVIMAGGKGQRMNPLSRYLPKCYLPIYDQPLLIKQLTWLKDAGINEVILTLSQEYGEMVSTLLSNHVITGDMKIHLVIETNVNGIGHALLELQDALQGETFLFLLGDEYFDQPTFFRQVGKIQHVGNILGVVAYEDLQVIQQGCNLELDSTQERVVRLIEKPLVEEIVSQWCWSGVAVFSQEIFSKLEELFRRKDGKTNHILIDAINKLIAEGVSVQYIHENSENINLTNIHDYYRAFMLEYQSKNSR